MSRVSLTQSRNRFIKCCLTLKPVQVNLKRRRLHIEILRTPVGLETIQEVGHQTSHQINLPDFPVGQELMRASHIQVTPREHDVTKAPFDSNSARRHCLVPCLVHDVDGAIEVWSHDAIAFRIAAVGVNGILRSVGSPGQPVNVGQQGRISEHVHVVAGAGHGPAN